MFLIHSVGKVRILVKRFIKQTVLKEDPIKRFDRKTQGKVLLNVLPLHLQILLTSDQHNVSLVMLYN